MDTATPRQPRDRSIGRHTSVYDWLPASWLGRKTYAEVSDDIAGQVDHEGEDDVATVVRSAQRPSSAIEDYVEWLDRLGVYQQRTAKTGSGTTRIVAVPLCRLPSPESISHADLLHFLADRVEDVAQDGAYDVVLFLDPAPHIPSLARLATAYFSLSHAVRKNVSRVYLVGGGWRTTLMSSIFSFSILSPHTVQRGKLRTLSTLSEFAAELGADAFRSLEIPLEVYIANSRREGVLVLQEDYASARQSSADSDQSLKAAAEQVPPLAWDCLAILAEQGPASVGIFRRSPSSANVAHLAAAYARGHPVRLDLAPDAPYLAASLFKRYLAELPESVFSRATCEKAKRCPLGDDDEALAFIRNNVCADLSPAAKELLRSSLPVLHAISLNSSHNLMTSTNLVLCVCPAFVGGIGASLEDVEMCRVPGMDSGSMKGLRQESAASLRGNSMGGVLKVMIDRYGVVFAEDPDPA